MHKINTDNLPIGAVGSLRVLAESMDSYFTYDKNSANAGTVLKDEEFFVYKIINEYYLIDNNKWVLYNSEQFFFKETKHIDEPVQQNEIIDDMHGNLPLPAENHDEEKHEEDIVEKSKNESFTVLEETPITKEEKHVKETIIETDSKTEKDESSKGLFKKIGKFFGVK